jgi:hypothetical protein
MGGFIRRVAVQHAHCNGEFGRHQRLLAQDWQLFYHKANIAVGFHQIFHLVVSFATIAAAVVHEFHDGD